ncbi:MAG: DUF177 domain-containing protein [Pyrinomonadaceae bacterium]
MNIDLNSFEREKAIDEMLPIGAVDLDLENARVVSPVTLTGKAFKTSRVTAIMGRLAGTVEIDCDRCLRPVQSQFDFALDLEFIAKNQIGGATNLELHSNDLKLDAIEGSYLDLEEIAREQIVLDLPQQFFCQDDCKGLCEKCGTDLNLNDCDCEDNEIDPRWAALKNLN